MTERGSCRTLKVQEGVRQRSAVVHGAVAMRQPEEEQSQRVAVVHRGMAVLACGEAEVEHHHVEAGASFLQGLVVVVRKMAGECHLAASRQATEEH